jgi:aminoglycoside phosphotransferase (APT) family kinase protein
VPCYSAQAWREKYRSFREEVSEAVLPLLSPDERAGVEAFWRRFLDNDRHFRFQPVLIHADLGLEHILVDRDRAEIAAVIDFADAVVGDPALDFVVLAAALGGAVPSDYALPIDESFLSRAHAYLQIGPFHEVLHGQQIQEQEYVESGLDGIRHRIVAGSKKHK